MFFLFLEKGLRLFFFDHLVSNRVVFFPDDGLRKYDMEFLKPSLVSWRRGSPTVTRVTKMDFWKAKDRQNYGEN